MAPPSPTQLRWRHRIETMIRVAQPALDLVLFAGDRLSRAVDRTPDEALPAMRTRAALRPSPTRGRNAAV